MYKLLCLGLGLCLLPFFTDAQSFPTVNASWQGTVSSIAGLSPFRQAVCGDTTINGRQYARFLDIEEGPDGEMVERYRLAVRTEGQAVYYVEAGEEEEHLLYDFSLEAGDEITVNHIGLPGSVTLKVASVINFGQGGDTFRQINFAPSGIFEESWIEGIGSTLGPINRGFAAIDAYPELRCFRRDGELKYHTAGADNCTFEYECSVPASTSQAAEETFELYPTASQGLLQFQNPHAGPVLLQAYGLDGRLSGQYGPYGQGRHQVNCSELSPGIYVFRLVETNKNLSLQHFKMIIAEN